MVARRVMTILAWVASARILALMGQLSGRTCMLVWAGDRYAPQELLLAKWPRA